MTPLQTRHHSDCWLFVLPCTNWALSLMLLYIIIHYLPRKHLISSYNKNILNASSLFTYTPPRGKNNSYISSFLYIIHMYISYNHICYISAYIPYNIYYSRIYLLFFLNNNYKQSKVLNYYLIYFHFQLLAMLSFWRKVLYRDKKKTEK